MRSVAAGWSVSWMYRLSLRCIIEAGTSTARLRAWRGAMSVLPSEQHAREDEGTSAGDSRGTCEHDGHVEVMFRRVLFPCRLHMVCRVVARAPCG